MSAFLNDVVVGVRSQFVDKLPPPAPLEKGVGPSTEDRELRRVSSACGMGIDDWDSHRPGLFEKSLNGRNYPHVCRLSEVLPPGAKEFVLNIHDKKQSPLGVQPTSSWSEAAGRHASHTSARTLISLFPEGKGCHPDARNGRRPLGSIEMGRALTRGRYCNSWFSESRFLTGLPMGLEPWR